MVLIQTDMCRDTSGAQGCRRLSGRLMGIQGGGSLASPQTFLLWVPTHHTHVVARPLVGPVAHYGCNQQLFAVSPTPD